MTSELRPAVEVWRAARDAWLSGNLGVGPNGFRLGNREAAAAVIEADREAVRAEMRQALIATGEAAATHLKELAKFKVLAETLAGAREAMTAMHKDLLLRAEIDIRDGTKIVHASNGVWLKFCAALKEIEGD